MFPPNHLKPTIQKLAFKAQTSLLEIEERGTPQTNKPQCDRLRLASVSLQYPAASIVLSLMLMLLDEIPETSSHLERFGHGHISQDNFERQMINSFNGTKTLCQILLSSF